MGGQGTTCEVKGDQWRAWEVKKGQGRSQEVMRKYGEVKGVLSYSNKVVVGSLKVEVMQQLLKTRTSRGGVQRRKIHMTIFMVEI